VIGVSPDPQETSDRFREREKLPFLLVGDPEGRITKAYRVRWPLIGLVQRVTYVIGPHKEIRIAFHSELQPEAHASQACQALVRPPA
jgi:peroxiredoxin Q/BCP